MDQVTMTAKQTAQYLGISYWKLTMMCKAGEIPHLRAGNRILFRKETLDRWMANQETMSIQSKSDLPIIRLARS